MIRPVETLNERTLLEEGIIVRLTELNPTARPSGSVFAVVPGFRLRVGLGTAEAVARRIVGDDPRLIRDEGLDPNEWAPRYAVPEDPDAPAG